MAPSAAFPAHGAQRDRQPPGSFGEAANGGIGQAGLRLRVPNEPGGSQRIEFLWYGLRYLESSAGNSGGEV
jgi:hypothetical protein